MPAAKGDEATAAILLSLATLSAGERRKLAARLKEEFQTSGTADDVEHDSDEESG